MSPALFVYVVLFLVAALVLWAAYRVLGTPSRLAPRDYQLVLDDILSHVEVSAERLRSALDRADGEAALAEVAAGSRKIFQTAYYQALRLRPLAGPDGAAPAREVIKEACEAYEWASRMAAADSIKNPAVRAAARRLLDDGERALSRARQALPTASPTESTPP